MAIDIEVMYWEPEPDSVGTATLRRVRVGLDQAHTLDRESIWHIILSAPSNLPAGSEKRILDGVSVDRVAHLQWDDSDIGVGYLLRRNGEVCLAAWEDISLAWVNEANPLSTKRIPSAIPTDFPKDALVFYFVPTPVSHIHSNYATAAFDEDMF